VLLPPVVLQLSVQWPTAVLFEPELAKSALKPTAVFLTPVVLLLSAQTPTAVLHAPVVLERSAL